MVDVPGQSSPGFPGGGTGYSGNRQWATGAGGGYTSVTRHLKDDEEELLMLAGSGGGGGCRDGVGGGDEEGNMEKTNIDEYSGRLGTHCQGGDKGRVVEHTNAHFTASMGSSYQGGSGSEYGAGGK